MRLPFIKFLRFAFLQHKVGGDVVTSEELVQFSRSFLKTITSEVFRQPYG